MPKYLTGIIASSLAWIEDEGAKEQIWEAAAARLSERSGRTGDFSLARDFSITSRCLHQAQTAIPSAYRSFNIPKYSSPQAVSTAPQISITLQEPSLTADNLGHKTWLASYLLAKRIHHLLPALPALCPFSNTPIPSSKNNKPCILELGAGTGLVGIAAATLFYAHVHLTDLPDIIPNLATNVHSNETLFEGSGGSASVGVLDWSIPISETAEEEEEEKYNIILAADPLYSPQHPPWLVQTIERHLKRGKEARVVIELPLREAYAPEVEDLKNRMEGVGLCILMQGEESGFDDWASGGERQEVRCWWAIWVWA